MSRPDYDFRASQFKLLNDVNEEGLGFLPSKRKALVQYFLNERDWMLEQVDGIYEELVWDDFCRANHISASPSERTVEESLKSNYGPIPGFRIDEMFRAYLFEAQEEAYMSFYGRDTTNGIHVKRWRNLEEMGVLPGYLIRRHEDYGSVPQRDESDVHQGPGHQLALPLPGLY